MLRYIHSYQLHDCACEYYGISVCTIIHILIIKNIFYFLQSILREESQCGVLRLDISNDNATDPRSLHSKFVSDVHAMDREQLYAAFTKSVPRLRDVLDKKVTTKRVNILQGSDRKAKSKHRIM